MRDELRKAELLEMLNSVKKLFYLIFFVLYSSLPICAAPPIFLNNPNDAFALAEDLKIDVFLLFTADWCASCNILKNDIHRSLDNFENIIFCYVDYDKHKDMAKQYDVKILPDYRIYRNKIEIKKKIGYNNKTELLQWIKQTSSQN